MIKEVLIQVNGKQPYLPSFLPARLLAREFPYNRIGSIIPAIKEEGLAHLTSIKKYEYKEIVKNPDVLYGFTDKKDYYALYNSETKEVITYHIVSVDTFFPWTIVRKNNTLEGGYLEYVETFKDITGLRIIDGGLNYGEKIGSELD